MVSEMIVRNVNDEFHDGGYFQDLFVMRVSKFKSENRPQQTSRFSWT